MTRFQAATFALSTWLAKARAPRGDRIARERDGRAPIFLPTRHQTENATRHTRGLTLPPRWQRPDPSLERAPVLSRLRRAMSGGDRHGIDSHK